MSENTTTPATTIYMVRYYSKAGSVASAFIRSSSAPVDVVFVDPDGRVVAPFDVRATVGEVGNLSSVGANLLGEGYNELVKN